MTIDLVLVISAFTSLNTGVYMWMLSRGDTRGWYLSVLAQVPWWAITVLTGAWGLLPLNLWLFYVSIRGVKRHRAGGVRAKGPTVAEANLTAPRFRSRACYHDMEKES